jgi:hypothetical protein
MKTVSLEMNVEQAQVICSALDLYNRISLGQFEELESLIRHRLISKFGSEKTYPDFEEMDKIRNHIYDIKRIMGFHPHGSYGIGNPNVHISNSRSYEMLKTIQKVLAEDRNPNPDFRTVDYDGVLVRYTQDQLPTCVIINETEENNDGC